MYRVLPDADAERHGQLRVIDEAGEEQLVRASYDRRTDTLNLILKVGTPVAESDEPRPGIILAFDDHGDLVSLEVLDASKRVTDADRMEFHTMK